MNGICWIWKQFQLNCGPKNKTMQLRWSVCWRWILSGVKVTDLLCTENMRCCITMAVDRPFIFTRSEMGLFRVKDTNNQMRDFFSSLGWNLEAQWAWEYEILQQPHQIHYVRNEQTYNSTRERKPVANRRCQQPSPCGGGSGHVLRPLLLGLLVTLAIALLRLSSGKGFLPSSSFQVLVHWCFG